MHTQRLRGNRCCMTRHASGISGLSIETPSKCLSWDLRYSSGYQMIIRLNGRWSGTQSFSAQEAAGQRTCRGGKEGDNTQKKIERRRGHQVRVFALIDMEMCYPCPEDTPCSSQGVMVTEAVSAQPFRQTQCPDTSMQLYASVPRISGHPRCSSNVQGPASPKMVMTAFRGWNARQM